MADASPAEGVAEEAMYVIRAVPVWEHLTALDSYSHNGLSRRQQRVMKSIAAFRGTSKTLRGLADALITKLAGVKLGDKDGLKEHRSEGGYDSNVAAAAAAAAAADDGDGSSTRTKDTAGRDIAPGQQQQEPAAISMLRRLTNLQELSISGIRGGDLPQLVQLLDHGLLARLTKLALMDFYYIARPSECPVPLDAIPRGMPLLEQLQLNVTTGTVDLLRGLSGCSHLHTLDLEVNGRSVLPPHLLADLSGCSTLHTLHLRVANNQDVPPGFFAPLRRSSRLHTLVLQIGSELPTSFFHDLASCTELRALKLCTGFYASAVEPKLAGLSRLTQLTKLEVCGWRAPVRELTRLTCLQELDVLSTCSLVGEGHATGLTALTALTALAWGQRYYSTAFPETHDSSACEEVWKELPALTQLRELDLGPGVCSMFSLVDSPASWQLEHLTRLALYLPPRDILALSPWPLGQRRPTLPALKHLCLATREGGYAPIETLHYLLHAAPDLKELQLWEARFRVPASDDGTSAQVVHQVATRLADIPTCSAFDHDFGLRLGLWCEGEELQPVLSGLEPLGHHAKCGRAPKLTLAFRQTFPEATAIAVLHDTIPQLESLTLEIEDDDGGVVRTLLYPLPAGVSTVQQLSRFRQLRALQLPRGVECPPGTIQILEAIPKLKKLSLCVPKRCLGLRPLEGGSLSPGFVALEHLDLNGKDSQQLHVSDLHYLLCTAPALNNISVGFWNAVIVVDDYHGAKYSQRELQQQLAEVMARWSVVTDDSQGQRISGLRFAGEEANRDMAAMFGVCQPLQPWGALDRVVLQFSGDLTLAAAQALVSGLLSKGTKHLTLKGCTIPDIPDGEDGGAVLDCLSHIPCLRELILAGVKAGPQHAKHLAAFTEAHPHIAVRYRLTAVTDKE